MTSPDVQKDIVNAIATEATKTIIHDLGDDLFTILVDEARDVSVKEQMAIVLRYVNQEGSIVERLLGISHVNDTKALTLKTKIDYMLVSHGLSFSRLRGQGYDGASNMKGEINGLKILILAENPSAYYVHCFSHQFQLTLVAVAKSHGDVSGFFTQVSSLINLVGSSCKRRDNIRDSQARKVEEALCHGELEMGRGLNQEIGLKRPSDTRWGSHFRILFDLHTIFSSLIVLLGVIEDEGGDSKGEANCMLKLLQSFEFAFILKMMTTVLSITNDLSIALQRKEQDILNAMRLFQVAKLRLQEMMDNGWEPLLDDVISFCN
ncbi:Zinc finger MYM-type protein 1 [Linum grandiflorum]